MNNDCVFCKMAHHKLYTVIIKEDAEILAIMDLYPATKGHILVLPKQHIENIYYLPKDLGARIMQTAITLANGIKEKLNPDGLNLVQANEMAAGQTILHFHLHIVPRYRGDQVCLRFGHGTIPANTEELKQQACLIRSALFV